MNGLATSSARRPKISEEIQARWQGIVDRMARVSGVPAGLITRVDPPQIEVFLSSTTERNPYHKGERTDLDTGHYSEKVIQQRTPLLVTDALKDPEWNRNPDIKLGMTFYLGYPLTWPDGEIFGTICILDGKINPQPVRIKGFVSESQRVVEGDLRLIIEICRSKDHLLELQRQGDHLMETVALSRDNNERPKKQIRSRSLCRAPQEVGHRIFNGFQKSDLDLKKDLDEIKKLKEQLEAEDIYLREEMKLKDQDKAGNADGEPQAGSDRDGAEQSSVEWGSGGKLFGD